MALLEIMLVEWREKTIERNYGNKKNDKTMRAIHFSPRVKQLGLDWLLSIKKINLFSGLPMRCGNPKAKIV
jgi:hypothetical protein